MQKYSSLSFTEITVKIGKEEVFKKVGVPSLEQVGTPTNSYEC